MKKKTITAALAAQSNISAILNGLNTTANKEVL